MSDNWKTAGIIGAVALGGYLLWNWSKGLQKTGDAVGDTVSTVGGNVGNITGSVANATDDILSLTNPIKSVSSGASKIIDKFFSMPDAMVSASQSFMGAVTGKNLNQSTPISSETYIKSAKDASIVKANLFTNPTGQSILPSDMSVYSPPMSIQNTVKLSKSSSSTDRILAKGISTNSTTARYTGGIGKSQITFKSA